MAIGSVAMPKVNCCGKELKDCKCGRLRRPERREKAERDKAEANTEPVKDLTDLLHRLDCRAEKRKLKAKEAMTQLIQSNDEKWKQRMEKDRKEILRIQEEKVDEKISQSETKQSAELEKLRKEIVDFTKGNTNVKVDEDSTTLLFGGLRNLSFDDAQGWIKEKIRERKLEEPEIMYFKGDGYVGFVFAKFVTSKAAEDVVKKMSKLKRGEEDVWCKKDLPLDRRVALSFLLGLRKQVIE